MLERLEQQKRLTANQWRIILTANLGDMLDFFDFLLIGYVLAFILKPCSRRSCSWPTGTARPG
jgi:MFS transporter, putative metabolite:H+ symporter